MSKAVQDAIAARFADQVLGTHAQCGDETVILKRDRLVDVCRYLKEDPAMRFDLPIDVTAVDYLDYPGRTGSRFEVVYHLYSTGHKHRIRLKVPLDEGDCRVPSVTGVWRGVTWFERETWDMYGVRFEGHPDLRRLLTYEEFEGHPLRKDYPLRGYQPLVPIARLDENNEDPKLTEMDLNWRPHFGGGDQ